MNYKNHFNHLGEMKEGDYLPWTLADKVLIALLWAVVAALCLGLI